MFKTTKISSRDIIRKRIEDSFKMLLGTKHLYQNVQVDYSIEGIKEIEKEDGKTKLYLQQEWTKLFNSNWIIDDPVDRQTRMGAMYLVDNILFLPPDLKLYCRTCNRIEAFNLKSGFDFSSHGNAINITKLNGNIIYQVFILSYLCQSCKLVPEYFLITRHGHRLVLTGRSPIEHVDVPRIIPKNVSGYYSDAIVAFQSGQPLAANFLLRTLIEQFTLSKTKSPESADDAINQYMNSLPDDFKSRFPSFREIYSNLSVDIHSAKGSLDVFEDSRSKIVKHFEARVLFELQ